MKKFVYGIILLVQVIPKSIQSCVLPFWSNSEMEKGDCPSQYPRKKWLCTVYQSVREFRSQEPWFLKDVANDAFNRCKQANQNEDGDCVFYGEHTCTKRNYGQIICSVYLLSKIRFLGKAATRQEASVQARDKCREANKDKSNDCVFLGDYILAGTDACEQYEE